MDDDTRPRPPLALDRVGYLHPDAVALVARVQAEYVERYGSPDESPVDPAVFDPPEGVFLLGRLGEVPVATGAWRRSPVQLLDAASAVEVKRMYVVPEQRGHGFARSVLAALEGSALEAGHDVVVLETGLRQPEAIELYLSSGYVAVPGFGYYKDAPLSRCFAKRLSP